MTAAGRVANLGIRHGGGLVLVVFAACGTRGSLRTTVVDAGDAGRSPTLPVDGGAETRADATMLSDGGAETRADATMLSDGGAEARADATMLSDGGVEARADAPLFLETQSTADDAPAVIDLESDRPAAVVDSGLDEMPADGCGARVSFQIQVDSTAEGSTLCYYPCDYVHATFSDGSLQLGASSELSYETPVVWLSAQPAGGCVARCDTCQPDMLSCHSCPGLWYPFTAASRTWDGSYFVEGSCNANRCMGGSTCAPAGHYVARFCVQRGVTSGGLCVPLYYLDDTAIEREACSSVEFALPSTASLSVSIGTAVPAGTAADAGVAVDLAGLVGSYRVGSSSGGLGYGGGHTTLAFADADLSVATGADADLVVTTNPVPGEFPGTCDIPVSLVTDSGGNWSLQNRTTTTCARAGATVTLYPGYYLMAVSHGNLAISAAGNTSGGAQSQGDTWGFAYSAVAVRVSAP